MEKAHEEYAPDVYSMYKQKSLELRKKVMDMMLRMKQGHPGSIYSIIEILVSLYYSDLTTLKSGKSKASRDKLIISKGHATQGVYPILEEFNYIPSGSCDKFGTSEHNRGPLRVFGNIKINGIDATTGSLGHGVGIGAGYALADKNDGNKNRTYVLISEGEMYEGSIWEAAMFASHNLLDNLTVIIDRNRKIILGDTEECLQLEPIKEKWESFGWAVEECDGHDFDKILQKLRQLKLADKPQVLLAHTIKGRGNIEMEGKAEWHYWQQARVNELVESANVAAR